MLPLLWLLLGTGIGAGATLLVKRGAPAALPGQIWTLVALARQTKPWTDMSKGDVARAIRAALEAAGLHVIDALWSGSYQLTVVVSGATPPRIGDVLRLGSEWADQATLIQIDQAPAAIPATALAPRFP